MRPRPRHGPARSPTQTSPCVVLVVVVVVAGEAAAWAGTITDLTTGLTRRSGKTSGLNEPPPNAICKMRRRSTVIVEDPPLARSMRRPRNIAKYPTARFRSSHNIPPASKANARTSIRRGGRDQHRALAQHGCWQSHCPPQCATARARRLSPQASAAVPRSTALPKPSVGQGLPLAPGPHDVESPIQHLAHLPGRSCRPPAR
jgi:hypothetical protein